MILLGTFTAAHLNVYMDNPVGIFGFSSGTAGTGRAAAGAEGIEQQESNPFAYLFLC